MAQAQAQAQIQELQARAELAKARSFADTGLGAERYSRIEENQALAFERMAQARKDDEAALLDKVRILKELDELDLGYVEKLINLANTIQNNMQNPIEKQTIENPTQSSSEVGNRDTDLAAQMWGLQFYRKGNDEKTLSSLKS